jgi:threonine/homoserine/homoserine lactone efflux protein
MNPIYALMESRHRWLILASMSFGAGTLGAVMFLAWGWSHGFDRLWFYLGLVGAVYFLWRAFQQWKEGIAYPTDEQTRAEPEQSENLR